MDWLDRAIDSVPAHEYNEMTLTMCAAIHQAHDAEVERATAELRGRLKGALIPAEVFGPDDICPKCSGWGFRAYPNTTTWHGGIGGQVITNDVCDTCWGTGQKHRIGANLKEAYYEHKRLRARIERLEETKNTAYAERQKMVQALTFIFPAHMKRHPDSDSEWEDDWRNIVCIHGPAGQMTWHIHDSEAHMFGHLNRKPDPFADCEYDDHTTPEKYDRLLRSVLQRFCMGAADAAEGEDDDTV